MNILMITQLYPQPDDAGGYKITHTVEYFCKEWVKEGHSVFVMHVPSKFPIVYYMVPQFIKNKLINGTLRIIPSYKSRRKLDYENLGIRIYRLPILKTYPGNAYSPNKLRCISKIIVKILENNHFYPDLVMGHFSNPSTELVANLSKYYGCKSSIVFHHDCDKTNIGKYRLRELCLSIKAIGCRSIYEAIQVKNDLNLSKMPFVCYSGVPNDAIEKAEKICHKHDYSKGTKYLFVGGFLKIKNADCVIKAFSCIRKQNDVLELIGAGIEENNLKQLVNDLGIQNSVNFSGRISREEVLQKMKESHIFAMISDYETYGMVYIEAMLQGCITIASKRGGFDGIIQDGENGFLCNPGDFNMLYEIFNKIASLSEEERNRIGQNAIDVGLNYSEKDVAMRYLNDVLKRNKE